MDEYIVTVAHAQWNNLFLVTASSKREAKKKVWDGNLSYQGEALSKGNTPYYKKDLTAVCSNIMHKEEGDVICLN